MATIDPANVPVVGDPVHARMRKWDGTPHWRAEMTYLGADEHGHWCGNPAGTQVSRPGAEFVAVAACVKLAPHDGWFVANFNGPQAHLAIYTDMATPPELTHGPDGWTLGAVDLDLDVVLTDDGRLRLDDEDEFAAHREQFGYPPEVVAAAVRSSQQVLAAIRTGAEPFATIGHRWLDRIG